ncbi:MAG: SRPBCC domain-containing protein [Anaerolineales bacterium]
MANDTIINKIVYINAPASEVWKALTIPDLMKKWMSETDITILTDWMVGSSIQIRGNLSGVNFENKGTVLQFEPENTLRYSHLSSLSRLPDQPESYSIIEFTLSPVEEQTALSVTVSNFPTEVIYKHLAFYWNVTPGILKRKLEEQV